MDLFVLIIIFGAATQLADLRSVHFAGIAVVAALMLLLGGGYIAGAMMGGGADMAGLVRSYLVLFAIYAGVFLAGFGLGRFLEARR